MKLFKNISNYLIDIILIQINFSYLHNGLKLYKLLIINFFMKYLLNLPDFVFTLRCTKIYSLIITTYYIFDL